ncbi:hypothetical protein GCM10027610_056320 [Dactylosporangium cerinum]
MPHEVGLGVGAEAVCRDRRVERPEILFYVAPRQQNNLPKTFDAVAQTAAELRAGDVWWTRQPLA